MLARSIRAIAARLTVSMIKLIQSSCTAVKTDDSSSEATDVTKVMMTAVMLTESWNCERGTNQVSLPSPASQRNRARTPP
jgi:hypothetical protein